MKKAKTKIDKHLTDGKSETDYGPTTLDRLCGVTVEDKYSYKTIEEYDSALQDMDKADLMVHSIKVGVLPTDDRERTVKRLLAAFRSYQGENIPIQRVKPQRQISKEALKILAEGK